MSGNRDEVRALLKKAEDVNAAQGDGMTALHWAAMKGDADMAQMLIVAGANIRAITRLNAYTPLYLAAQQGSAPVIEVLVKAGADVKGTTANGTTPLMVAAASGEVAAVKALIDHGADVEAKDKYRGQTALMYAAANNRAAVIEALIAKGAERQGDEHRERPERADARRPRLRRQPGSARRGAPGRPRRRARWRGAGGRTPGGTSGAAAAGAPAGGQGGGRPAAPAGRPPQVAGADRNYQLNELVKAQGGLTPLLFAVRQGYTESVDALLKAGAPINQVCAGDKTSPLLMAVINGHFDLAMALLDKGADPNLRSDNGAAPLYAALNVEWAPKALYPQPRAHMQQKTSYLDLMTKLLDKGADPNARLNKKVWYSGYSFDLSGVDEIGATRVLARRLRGRHRGDEDARRARRRSEHPDHEAGGPLAVRRLRSRDRGRVGPAAVAHRRSLGDAAHGRRRRGLRAKASPPTRTATRPRDCWRP